MPRKLKKNSPKRYFTQETEDAIVKYNELDDPAQRDKLFEKEIHYPFYKLVENIIHTYKLRYTDTESLEDLKHKIVSILVEEKIGGFDPSVGAKAYSYFGTIVKRWLINYSNKNYKEIKKKSTIDSLYDTGIEPVSFVEDNSVTLSEFFDIFINQIYSDLETYFPKERDQEIADAVLTVFSNREDLEVFKKKALYIYIKELTDCKTAHLTKVVKELKRQFYKLYKDYNKEGLIRGYD